MEFAPGRSELTEQAHAKLRTLSTALTDRPALKIDATGRATPDADREGLKRAMLDRAVRAQKVKTRAGEGESTASLDAVTIDAEEYPKLLARVYADTDLPDKPRNALGMAKSIPAAEMEAMLVQSYRVDDQALGARWRAQRKRARDAELLLVRRDAVDGWQPGRPQLEPAQAGALPIVVHERDATAGQLANMIVRGSMDFGGPASIDQPLAITIQ